MPTQWGSQANTSHGNEHPEKVTDYSPLIRQYVNQSRIPKSYLLQNICIDLGPSFIPSALEPIWDPVIKL